MTETGSPVVLVVEDEPDVAETYRRWLDSSYDVRIAASGREALERFDDTVDVVLLDRMMPEVSGGEVLDGIRDSDHDCRVAMVTAVDADFDVIEMGFDAYVDKPPDRDELESTVERLLERATLDDELQAYYSLVARRSALSEEKTEAELQASDEYAALLEDIEAAREAADADLGDMASDPEFVGAVREIVDEEAESTADPEDGE
jgi:DNA-binding response OmpR family regulator